MAPFWLSRLDHEPNSQKRKWSNLHPGAPECEEVPPEEAKVLDNDDEDRNYLNTMCQRRGTVQPLAAIEQEEWHRKIGCARYHG